MIRSPLRYPGGKSRAIERIVNLIPSFREFREPFVGGGSVFIRLKQQFPRKKFWINDKYAELIKFWSGLQKDSEQVINQIWIWKREFSGGKTLHRFLHENKHKFNNAETAAAFFIFNRISFSGTTEAGGYSEQAFQKRFTDSSIERLIKMRDCLGGVKITNHDYEKVIFETGEKGFLFLDPPYFSSMNSALYGKNGNLHKTFDHERFAENLKNCPHRWLLTYDDSPLIRELYRFANVGTWHLMYGMRNQKPDSNQQGREIFISNRKIQISQKSFAALT